MRCYYKTILVSTFHNLVDHISLLTQLNMFCAIPTASEAATRRKMCRKFNNPYQICMINHMESILLSSRRLDPHLLHHHCLYLLHGPSWCYPNVTTTDNHYSYNVQHIWRRLQNGLCSTVSVWTRIISSFRASLFLYTSIDASQHWQSYPASL